MSLCTTNPEYLTYDRQELFFAVLGGVRLDGLDRLRVTVKIDFKDNTIRHNLDLYNDSQVDRLVRKCAERFSLGVSYMTKAISELIGLLEEYRLQCIKEAQSTMDSSAVKVIGEEEKAAATKFLSSPKLLQRTNALIAESGVVNEEINRLLMYLVFTTRKTDFPLHIITLGYSGSGKTYLQEKIAGLVPDEDLIEITTLSENALYYFGQRELKGKVICIEDLDGAETALYPLRELMSKRHITKTVALKNVRGETKTHNLKVEGPVTVAGCTTKESLYEDNANRCLLIQVDGGPEQDVRIMNYQRQEAAGRIDRVKEKSAKELLKNCQRLLEPVSVRNPYAEHLVIPPEVFKPRRTNAHYLRFIEAITFYKQYQRKKLTDTVTGEVYIETTLEDIKEANTLIKDVLLAKSDRLPHATREYFERLKQYLKEAGEKTFTSKDISICLRIAYASVKRYHQQLLQGGYIKTQPKKKGEKALRYEVLSMEEYHELKNRISTVLDDAIKKIEE